MPSQGLGVDDGDRSETSRYSEPSATQTSGPACPCPHDPAEQISLADCGAAGRGRDVDCDHRSSAESAACRQDAERGASSATAYGRADPVYEFEDRSSA